MRVSRGASSSRSQSPRLTKRAGRADSTGAAPTGSAPMAPRRRTAAGRMAGEAARGAASRRRCRCSDREPGARLIGREIEHALIDRARLVDLLGARAARRRARDTPRSAASDRSCGTRTRRASAGARRPPARGARSPRRSPTRDRDRRRARRRSSPFRALECRPSRSPASSIASASSRRNRKSSGASSTAALRASTDFAATAVERRDCDGVANAIGSSIPSSSGARGSFESSGRELAPSASASRIPGIGSGGALRVGCPSGSSCSAAGSTPGESIAGDAASETSIDSALTGREGRAFSSKNASTASACGRSASGIDVSATDGGAGSAGTDSVGESTGDGIDARRERWESGRSGASRRLRGAPPSIRREARPVARLFDLGRGDRSRRLVAFSLLDGGSQQRFGIDVVRGLRSRRRRAIFDDRRDCPRAPLGYFFDPLFGRRRRQLLRRPRDSRQSVGWGLLLALFGAGSGELVGCDDASGAPTVERSRDRRVQLRAGETLDRSSEDRRCFLDACRCPGRSRSTA